MVFVALLMRFSLFHYYNDVVSLDVLNPGTVPILSSDSNAMSLHRISVMPEEFFPSFLIEMVEGCWVAMSYCCALLVLYRISRFK